MAWLSLVTTCLLLGVAYCDYACVCSYNEEINVYDTADTSGNIIGQMYEFDCKPDAAMVAPSAWTAVMYQHQVGYIQVNSDINNQSCQGAIPDEDKLLTTMGAAGTTTMSAMTTPAPIMTTTTTVMETSTMQPQTTAPTTAAATSLNPSTGTPMMSSTMMSSSVPPQTPESTTTIPTTVTIQTQTPAPTTSLPVTTIPVDVTSGRPAIITGHIELCPTRIQQQAQKNGVILAQYGDNCYEVVQQGVSWTHAESICKQNGGHLAHIASQAEQDFIHTVLVNEHSHTVWLGLHDRKSEEHFEWTSGNAITFENWMPGRKDTRYHGYEDCVFMRRDGQWDDIECGGNDPFQEAIQGIRHSYVCQFATTNAAPLDGDLAKCAARLQNLAVRDSGILGQHNNSCYELIYHKSTWPSAERSCQNRGGHLASITNADEQAFVEEFMSRHSANHAVWIGLNDRNTEGRYQWSSGEVAQYTNWDPNHLDNIHSHRSEDCVLFVPYENGKWDDVVCENSGGIFFGTPETHPFLCRFGLSSATGGVIIGRK